MSAGSSFAKTLDELTTDVPACVAMFAAWDADVAAMVAAVDDPLTILAICLNSTPTVEKVVLIPDKIADCADDATEFADCVANSWSGDAATGF